MVFTTKIEEQLGQPKAIVKGKISVLGLALIIAKSIEINLSQEPRKILLSAGNYKLGHKVIGRPIKLSMIGICRSMSLPKIEIMILSSTLTIKISKKRPFTPLGTHLRIGKIPKN